MTDQTARQAPRIGVLADDSFRNGAGTSHRAVPRAGEDGMTPEELPEVFGYGWSLPKPDAFLDYFLPRIAPDAVFTQPMFPRAIGHQQIADTFRQLFALVPNLTAVPVRGAIDQSTVFIESTCTGTLARRRVQFMVCDCFEVCEGRIVERHSYSDSLALLLAVLRHPSTWPQVLKARR